MPRRRRPPLRRLYRPAKRRPGRLAGRRVRFAGVRGHRVRRCRLDRPDLQRFGADFRPYPAFYGAGNRGVSAPSGRIRRHDAGRRRAPPASTAISALSGGAGDSAFCPVGVLASAVGKRPRFVARDLRRMIGLGLFPGARVDDEGTCLMLDDETYRYYLAARQKRDEEAGRRKKTAPETTAPSDEAQSVIAEGRRLLDRIRACNDEIPGRRFPGASTAWMRSPPPSSLMLRRTRRSCPRSGGFSTTICPPPSVCSRRTNPSVASRSRESIWTRPVPRSRARWTPWCRPFPTCWTA